MLRLSSTTTRRSKKLPSRLSWSLSGAGFTEGGAKDLVPACAPAQQELLDCGHPGFRQGLVEVVVAAPVAEA